MAKILSMGRAVVCSLCATVLGLALVATSPQVACGQPAPVVDSTGQALVENHPGGAVIGLLRGDTTAVHGFGAVDSTGRRPTARTVFEIGSVTKTFTGLLLADAIERGEVGRSTSVTTLLPDSVTVGTTDSTTMTLGHLATHRSGLPRLPSNLGATARPGDPYATYGDSALYAFLDDYTLSRAPGAKYEYSNLGMGLLGHLLTRRADTTYAALVRRRITGPLGLSDTRIRLTDAQHSRFAQGHTRAGAPTSPWHFEALAGAGALRSTAADLLAYLRAHRHALEAASGPTLALQRAMRRAATIRAATNRENTRIGLGWHQSARDGHEVLWHNGGTGGFRSFVALDRETGHGVVVLTSTPLSSQVVLKTGRALLRGLQPD
ncbi:serine hydrolase domain-containing protein [Salinibacter ruber]|uniref:serine hydrolase domain-containing protein n=1 Tax=Salinibacter ruber TaxID=146919 RepID=UPI0021681945|nr:serine hydrolase domain-containing protein [Salinibacter ruber]MCS4100363.1 CubicO group peptidase (beta-lactamase class C family) [Salinibacter ruber]